jgi:hypothetical protein
VQISNKEPVFFLIVCNTLLERSTTATSEPQKQDHLTCKINSNEMETYNSFLSFTINTEGTTHHHNYNSAKLTLLAWKSKAPISRLRSSRRRQGPPSLIRLSSFSDLRFLDADKNIGPALIDRAALDDLHFRMIRMPQTLGLDR